MSKHPNGLAVRPGEPRGDDLVWYGYLHNPRRLCDTGGLLLSSTHRAELQRCYDLALKSPEQYAFLYFSGGKTFTSPIGGGWGNAVIPDGFAFSGYYSVTLSGPGVPRKEGWHWWTRAEGGYMAGGFMKMGEGAAPDPSVEFIDKPGRQITERQMKPEWRREGSPVDLTVRAAGVRINIGDRFTKG